MSAYEDIEYPTCGLLHTRFRHNDSSGPHIVVKDDDGNHTLKVSYSHALGPGLDQHYAAAQAFIAKHIDQTVGRVSIVAASDRFNGDGFAFMWAV